MNFHDHAANQPKAAPPRERRRAILEPSMAFPLSKWDLDQADTLEKWADAIESMAIITRLAHRELRQARTVAGVTTLIPPMASRPIHELDDRDLERLVDRLREAAAEKRAKDV